MDKRIGCVQDQGWMDITVPPEMTEEFKMLVRRATSTWQDMSPEMRDFADRVLGVENIMGQNMKEGHSSNTSSPRSMSFHGIKLIEDLGLPPNAYVVVAIDPVTRAVHKKLNPEKYPLCDGHPETCNCPKHCR